MLLTQGLRALLTGHRRWSLSSTMLADTRRWLIFLVLTAATFLFLYQLLWHPSMTRRDIDLPSAYIPKPKLNDGKFRWSDRTPTYPVTKLSPLPFGKPIDLPRVQHKFKKETSEERSLRLKRREAVKDVFKRGWQSYRSRAWMMDELAPISGRGKNAFGGWSATLVDALDTLWIMDMKTEFGEAAKAARDIDFSTSTDESINVFETTIRYLGGFLAAYDLSGDQELLYKAVEVGEMLLVPFDTPNHYPITRWIWQNAKENVKQVTPDWQLVSELGSFTLEFTRLSQLTGDSRWFHASNRISKMLEEQQMLTHLPGMWPVVIDARNENMTNGNAFTLGGMSDSAYEYLPKAYALLGGLAPQYAKMYELAMSTAIDELFFRPMVPESDDILMSGGVTTDGDNHKFDPENQHLTCFTGGMLGLGGRLIENETHVELGEKITQGCIWAYKAMERGIMPEIAHFVPCASKIECPWVEARWHDEIVSRASKSDEPVVAENMIAAKNLPKGYTDINDRRYILRPEAIESVFIMYRITGKELYREAAWEMFKSIDSVSRTDYANAAIRDISAPLSAGDAPKEDRMESFWMAETLKYFYLIFSEPDTLSLDEFVLNTEAHPLRRLR